jgi:hypothetical protein
MKVIEFDIIFLSYDEPNAEIHYADLCNKVPWAKRVHGVKGSDNAHKAAAEKSETDWFVTVDADNIVDSAFFNVDLDMSDPKIQVYGWCGRNKINGLRYGNGGLKIWKKDFVFNMKTHENSDSDRGQVDFCWEDGYRNFPRSFSESIMTGSPYQAWRAGFREGVKMTLLDGVKVPPQEIQQRIWWHNIHRLRMWSTVGAHEENGIYAVYGARLGTWMANCTDWNYVEVRDFEILKDIWNDYCRPYEEDNGKGLTEAVEDLGDKIKINLGLDWPYLDPKQSKYTLDLYNETMNLNDTYFQMLVPANV